MAVKLVNVTPRGSRCNLKRREEEGRAEQNRALGRTARRTHHHHTCWHHESRWYRSHACRSTGGDRPPTDRDYSQPHSIFPGPRRSPARRSRTVSRRVLSGWAMRSASYTLCSAAEGRG